MDIRDRRAMKDAAGESLARASYDPRKLILIHTAAVLALSLVLLLIHYVLERQIGGTGGLSGMGTRSILETAQSVLQLGQVVLLPFWQIGWLFASMQLMRRQQTGPNDLLEGFRRFFPVLRLMLLQGILYFGAIMACVYISTFLFMLTPWAQPLMELSMTAADAATMTNAMMAMMEDIIAPLMAILGITFVVIAAPLLYRFRLAQYFLLDHTEMGAMFALRASRQMMRGNAMQLFKLDLSFWWYYALTLLVAAVNYSDVLLAELGVTLPWSAEVSYFGAFVLYALCSLLLAWSCQAKVDVTYAQFYEAASQPPDPEPQE